jgi:hypothetical protein
MFVSRQLRSTRGRRLVAVVAVLAATENATGSGASIVPRLNGFFVP